MSQSMIAAIFQNERGALMLVNSEYQAQAFADR